MKIRAGWKGVLQNDGGSLVFFTHGQESEVNENIIIHQLLGNPYADCREKENVTETTSDKITSETSPWPKEGDEVLIYPDGSNGEPDGPDEPVPDTFDLLNPCNGCFTVSWYKELIHTWESDEHGLFNMKGGICQWYALPYILEIDPLDLNGYPHIYFHSQNLGRSPGGCFQEWYLDGAIWIMLHNVGGDQEANPVYEGCIRMGLAAGWSYAYTISFCQDVYPETLEWVQPSGLPLQPVTYPDIICDGRNPAEYIFPKPDGQSTWYNWYYRGQPFYTDEIWLHHRTTSTYIWTCYNSPIKTLSLTICDECDDIDAEKEDPIY